MTNQEKLWKTQAEKCIKSAEPMMGKIELTTSTTSIPIAATIGASPQASSPIWPDPDYMQPVTSYCSDPVVDTIIKKFITRHRVGMVKYGVTMGESTLPTLAWINHAQEEAMDFILYLERLKGDIK